MMIFEIIDHLNLVKKIEGKKEWTVKTEKVHNVVVYGYKGNYHDTEIIPSTEQCLIMQSLADGEVSNKTADRMVSSLYLDMILLNPKSNLHKFMPEMCEQMKIVCKDYEIKSK
jgi:hypothetical protein